MFWFVFKEKAHPSVSLPDVWAQVDYYSPVQVINYKAEIEITSTELWKSRSLKEAWKLTKKVLAFFPLQLIFHKS